MLPGPGRRTSLLAGAAAMVLAGGLAAILGLLLALRYLSPSLRPVAGFLLALGAAAELVLVAGFAAVWRDKRGRSRLRYVPDYDVLATSRPSDPGREVFRNPYLRVHVADANGPRVSAPSGDEILAGYALHVEDDHGERHGFERPATSVDVRPGGALVALSDTSETCATRVLWQFDGSPQASVTVEVRFRRRATVRRMSLALRFAAPVTEVYLPSGRRALPPLAAGYWLDRQGAKFGSGAATAIVYHAPEVSSLQLDTRRSQLWINLDFWRDHPYFHVPVGEHWRDESCSSFDAGETLACRFSLTFGHEPGVFPRLLPHRDGCLATYVWTEHACNSHLDLHKAVYLGSAAADAAAKTARGFVGRRIPVTKTIFWANQERVPYDYAGTPFQGPMLALADNDPFREFLLALREQGLCEIGLHCPQPTTSPQAAAEEAIRSMRERFGSRVWIDHLALAGERGVGCRESFNSDGARAGSPHSLRDAWARHGTEYFWNPAFEYFPLGLPGVRPLRAELRHLRLWAFVTGLWERIIPYPDAATAPPFMSHLPTARSTGLPLPRYWRHRTATGRFISWPTYHDEQAVRPEDWDILYGEAALEAFAASGETFMTHAYPVRVADAHACWRMGADGRAEIEPRFDLALARLRRFADEGKIDLSTVSRTLDHWRRLETVRYEVPGDGTVRVVNGGSERIAGLSFALQAAAAEVEGAAATIRRTPLGLVCRLDLEPGAAAVFRAPGPGREPWA